MNNYCCFTNYNEDGFMMDLFNYASDEKLSGTLNEYFDELEIYLNNFSETFKYLFKGKDYNEYFDQTKALIENLNDMKIIINILVERHIDE